MNILLVLIPVTLLVIGIAVTLFFWAVNHQQFDDLDSPGVLPLLDEPPPTDSADAMAATGAAAMPTPADQPQVAAGGDDSPVDPER